MGGRPLALAALAFVLAIAPGHALRAESTDSGVDRGSVVNVTVGRGGTLIGTLLRAHVDRTQAYAAVAALRPRFDPRAVRAGDRVSLQLDGNTRSGRHRLRSLHLATRRHQEVTVVAREDGSFGFGTPSPERERAARSFVVQSRSGTITDDLSTALAAGALPRPVIDEVVAAFAYAPDMPIGPAPGSLYTVVFETPVSAGGTARLRYASLQNQGEEYRVYRYPLKGGNVAFVEPSGRGVVPLHLDPPIPDAEVTSPWGWRIHPVLGVLKFHNGIDFGVPTGTPVRASADGVVERSGWRGNYGRYLLLRHSERVETAYAHLSRFARSVRCGNHVRRGEIIGYAGRSGLATGPHLYYEVLIDRQQVDPGREDLVLPIQLAGQSLSHFQSYIEQVASSTAAR